ncbi:MAG: DUF4012 domain-containing protein [Candidatus Pacebacteria bacterium]|nr:DUF4012 domain-containing protein [Candidatus Paceibacterota bacterium]
MNDQSSARHSDELQPKPNNLNQIEVKTTAPSRLDQTQPKESNKKRFDFGQLNKINLWPKKKWQQLSLIAGGVFLFLLLLLGVLGLYTYKAANQLKTQAFQTKFNLQQAYDLFKSQDLVATEQKLITAQESLTQLEADYQARLGFYGKIPLLKKYYQDGQSALSAGQHGLKAGLITAQALTPYADVLGFQGQASFEGGTAENRIKVMLDTLDKVMPQFDQIEQELNQAKNNLNQIDPNRYPEQIRGFALRQTLVEGQAMADQTISMVSEFRPVLEQLPEIAGSKQERKKYLILFQNDNELRPTGGFLTAYAVVYVEDGKVTPEKSDDIYELDQRFRQRVEIPEALGRYLTTERYWNLRDMNISPDFKISMDQFFSNYQTVRGEPDKIDGIIALDTNVLTRLLEIVGPTQVPGYGTFSAEEDPRCNCPQVVYALSEIITKPTPYHRQDRKGVLGPLMQALLMKTYGAPKQKFADLFDMTWKSIKGRHVQLYFIDQKSQQAAEAINAAGRLIPTEKGDFLAIVDANLGGAKSNLFTEYEVEQYISGPSNGVLNKTVEITYRNNRRADNCNLEAGQLCLNSTLQDWHRLYLPLGSELVEAQGFTQEAKVYQDLGFTVIDGFFKLEPLGVAKVKLTYTVPYELDSYQLYIWKQGGVDPYETLIDVNGGQEKLLIDQDKEHEQDF